MTDFLLWVERLAPSTFIRESPSIWGYAMFLFVHVLGMAFLVGGATVMSFALMGLWPRAAAIKPLERLFPFMWVGFGLVLVTGVGLFMAEAVARYGNWDFWVKMVFVAAGVLLMIRVRRTIFADPQLDQSPLRGAKSLAWAWLGCWFAAIIGGRLIAYVGPVPGLF